MARPTKRTTAAAVAVVALIALLVGCSGGDKRGTGTSGTTDTTSSSIAGSTNWDTAAVQSLAGIAGEITHAFKGQCTDVGLLPRDQFLVSAQKLKLESPLAVADCTAFGQQVELNAFPSAAKRDAYDTARTAALCIRARAGKFLLSGIHWVTTETASIQGADEGTSRQVADAVGGNYRGLVCPGMVLDWEVTAEARLKQLAAALRTRPNLSCDDFQLLDRDTYARDGRYAGHLPAAYARCNGPGVVIWIAVFSKTSGSPDSFLSAETKVLCGSQGGVVAVRGSGWAIIVADAHVAAIIAAALGGTAGPPAC